MKKYSIFLLLFVFACQHRQPSGKDIIVVSIAPQKYFIDRIAGNLFDLEVLLPPGANHSTYSLLPSQMKELSKAKAWFRMEHLTFEEGWYHKIVETNPQMKVFTASNGIKLLSGKDECEEHHHDQKEGIDPHYWMSPSEGHVIIRNILNNLIQLYPEKEEFFRKNYTSLDDDITALEKRIQDLLKDSSSKSFLIFHPSLAYFAREFGLEQIAIEDMGKEPTVKHVQEVVERAKKENIKAIFIQKEYDQENAQIIAQEIGAQVIQIDPMMYDWIAGMNEIVSHLKTSLKK